MRVLSVVTKVSRYAFLYCLNFFFQDWQFRLKRVIPLSLITKARVVFLNRKNVSFEFYPLYVA